MVRNGKTLQFVTPFAFRDAASYIYENACIGMHVTFAVTAKYRMCSKYSLSFSHYALFM